MITYTRDVGRGGNSLAYEVEFYQKENGEVPVKGFLESLPVKLGAKTLREIELLREHGFDLKEPHIKPIKGKVNKGIYELRIKFSTDICRVFYFVYSGSTFILLHGFVKKTIKTPAGEIDRARKYKEDYERRCNSEQ